MRHGGEIYDKTIEYDFSVSLNPNPCPKEVYEEAVRGVEASICYPDTSLNYLRDNIGQVHGISGDNIVCANGASELINAVVRYVNPKETLICAPSFYGYRHAINAVSKCRGWNSNAMNSSESCYKVYMLNESNDYSIGEDYLDYITPEVELCILCNPNNPTGRLVDYDLLIKIIDKCNSLNIYVLVDECFLMLSRNAKSVASLCDKYEKLIVVNAYTKLFSIPGIRFGYAVAGLEVRSALKDILPEWNVSVPAIYAAGKATEILLATDYINESLRIIEGERAYLEEKLSLCGISYIQSDTNFMLLHTRLNLYEELCKRNILIRECSNFEGLGPNYYRIAVKSHKENEKLVEALYSI